jgi:DNA-binding response OmpR family regulator
MARPKAFIVDDDPTFVKILENTLNQAEFTPFESYVSGEECLANINRKPRIVLLDFSLGGLNGLDVLKSIKKKSPKTDVIMLTAVEDDMVKQKCFEAGATNYINKDPDGIDRLQKEVFPNYKGGFFSFLR